MNHVFNIKKNFAVIIPSFTHFSCFYFLMKFKFKNF